MYTIKITNIPRWISEIHLKNFFTGCGKVLQAEIALDKDTLRSLGYGYITFADEQALHVALEKDGVLLDGSKIQVSRGNQVEEVEV